jgi:tRNA A-37 threonylcarbamoyl transferase component Bud32
VNAAIERALPFEVRRVRSLWRLADERTAALLGAVEALIADWESGGRGFEERGAPYKRTDRKLVARIEAPPRAALSAGGPAACVAKAFRLRRLSHQLRHRRFAEAEARNLLLAAERGIAVPRVLGIGRLQRRPLLVQTAVLLVELLEHREPLLALLRDAARDRARVDALLEAVLPVFLDLYRAGCHHIDMNGANLLVRPHDLALRPYVVDFQHARFGGASSLEHLSLAAGRFARSALAVVDSAALDAWLEALLDAAGVLDAAARGRLRQRFAHYRDESLSRRERRAVRA